jgi:hypothetical protein
MQLEEILIEGFALRKENWRERLEVEVDGQLTSVHEVGLLLLPKVHGNHLHSMMKMSR